jgi:hypothetical protein
MDIPIIGLTEMIAEHIPERAPQAVAKPEGA